MPWSSYKGPSAGRVIQFVYRYCGIHIAERIQIGDGEITLHQKPFATYVWEVGNIPHFTFAPAYAAFQEIQKLKKQEVSDRENMLFSQYANKYLSGE